MRRFTIERGEGEKGVTIEVDGQTATTLWSGSHVDGRTYTSSLRMDDDADCFIYRWDHGGGQGGVRIPADIMYDLPEMLAVLNVVARTGGKPGMFGEIRIYEQEPVATLFPRSSK
jgi:hypothetical protein